MEFSVFTDTQTYNEATTEPTPFPFYMGALAVAGGAGQPLQVTVGGSINESDFVVGDTVEIWGKYPADSDFVKKGEIALISAPGSVYGQGPFMDSAPRIGGAYVFKARISRQ